MVASMIRYAEERDPSRLANLDFRIVLMGAASDAASQEPFCHYPDKLLTLEELGVAERVDCHWRRADGISCASLDALCSHLLVRKRALVPVSCGIFAQVVDRYNKEGMAEALVLRDNPNPGGDTDYFAVADQVQKRAQRVLVPSDAAAKAASLLGTEVMVVGHGPTDEWLRVVAGVDGEQVMRRLKLDGQRTLLVYAGAYGDFYEPSLRRFLDLMAHESVQALKPQVLILPHPRFQGRIEAPICSCYQEKIRIMGPFFQDSPQYMTMREALAIADLVVTADATSTIVIQASALGKLVLHVNPTISKVSRSLYELGMLERVSSPHELAEAIRQSSLAAEGAPKKKTALEILGIPEGGAKLLWEAFLEER